MVTPFNSEFIYREIEHLKFNLTDGSDLNAMPFTKRQCILFTQLFSLSRSIHSLLLATNCLEIFLR